MKMATKSQQAQVKEQFVSKTFNIGLITPLTVKRNSEILCKSAEPLCELGFNLSILAIGDQVSQEQCMKAVKKYPQNFHLLESIPKNHSKILKESQIVIFTSTPEKEILLELSEHNIIPVMPDSETYGVFENFNAQQEKGNCFLYEEGNYWTFLATIIRSYENFKFPYDWSQLNKSFKKAVEEL